MDPDTCLAQIRALYRKLYPTEDDVVQLAQLIEDLDGWLTKGGQLPEAWQPAPLIRTHYPAGAVLDAPEGHASQLQGS
jgi:hypothetical protein